jgi:hypothetical protein
LHKNWLTGRWRALLVVAFTLAFSGFLLLIPLPLAWEGGWRSRLFDLGHVPLFAVITLVLAHVFGGWHWGVMAALSLAALIEFAQHFVGRSGDLADFLRGAAGVLAAGASLLAIKSTSRFYKVVYSLLAIGFVAVPAIEVGPRLIDAVDGISHFPVLADFSTDRQQMRWQCRQATLTRMQDPDRPEAFVGRLEFRPGRRDYPGALLEHISRDFTGYNRLCWSFTVEGGPVTLMFSLRGRPGPDTCHYQFGQTFGPGEHEAVMDLPTAICLARPRPLIQADLWWSQVFIVRPQEKHVIYLRRIWLE